MQSSSYKYDIIIVGLQPWEISLGSNCVDIAKVLSTFSRVLYVNRASDLRTELRRNFQAFTSFNLSFARRKYSLTKAQENIWVLETGVVLSSINLLKGKLYQSILRRNNKKFALKIKKAVAALSFSDFLLLNDNDFFQAQYLKEELAPKLYIYYLRDYLIEQPYFKRNGKMMEQALMSKADYVFTNSLFLKNYAAQYNKSSLYVGQGTNLKLDIIQKEYQKPKELSDIRTPVIGYLGNLTTLRLDLGLLEEVVEKRKDLTWVFVGPLDQDFEKSKLKYFDHVRFTGSKPQDAIAQYITHFDVCINPQLLNETTIGNYPRKVDEYMFFGKPIVARKTNFIEELGDLIYSYEHVDDFLVQLELALAEQVTSEKQAKRKSLAQSHTWENSVFKMFDFMGLSPKTN